MRNLSPMWTQARASLSGKRNKTFHHRDTGKNFFHLFVPAGAHLIARYVALQTTMGALSPNLVLISLCLCGEKVCQRVTAAQY
jgi:hypothetical protein